MIQLAIEPKAILVCTYTSLDIGVATKVMFDSGSAVLALSEKCMQRADKARGKYVAYVWRFCSF